MSPYALAPIVLADPSEDQVTPGLLGFVVVAVLCVAVWMLARSLHRHLRAVEQGTTPQPGRLERLFRWVIRPLVRRPRPAPSGTDHD